MFYTYVLKSEVAGDIYVGSCENIEIRVTKHNRGLVRSTKAYRPWKLLEYKEFPTRSEAFRHEMFLKSGQQKEILRRKYC
jgi:putative endonuclease